MSPRSRLSPWPSATSPSAPPRPPSTCRASPSRSFILLARTLSHAAEPRNVATRRRASWLTFDAPPRRIPPRVVNNSSVTRRAAVAGVLAFFVRAAGASRSRLFRHPPSVRPPSRRERVSSAAATHRSPSTSVSSPSSPRRPPPRPSACARRMRPSRTAPTPGPCPSPRARGSASTRPPRVPQAREQAAVMKAYGLERGPASKRQKSHLFRYAHDEKALLQLP